jgi:hypothetical protein
VGRRNPEHAEHVRLRGRIYYATVYIDGRKREGSTGCTSEAEALVVLERWKSGA